jgi:hypothetical protein
MPTRDPGMNPASRPTGRPRHPWFELVTHTTAAPQARPFSRVEWNLPLSANPAVFGGFSRRVSLEDMKNTNQKATGAPGASETKQEKKAPVTKLPRMEMYAVLGLELSKKILEKLEEVEESVEILARQKARELDPEQSGTEQVD